MKNVICPISNSKVPEHLPRVTAFFNIVLMGLFIYHPNLFILTLIMFDFLARGFGYQQYSILHSVALKTSKALNLKSKSIDKAPKQFAARLGAIMFLTASVFYFFGGTTAAIAVVSMVALLSILEAAFSFCVGCYIYTYLVLPVYKQA